MSGLGSGPSYSDFNKCEDLKDELDLKQTQLNHKLFEIEPSRLTNLVRDNSVIAIEAMDSTIETFKTPQKTLVKFTEVTLSAPTSSNKKTGFKWYLTNGNNDVNGNIKSVMLMTL